MTTTQPAKLETMSWRGTQSQNRRTILRADGHTLRVEIKHDSVQYQSHSRIDRWDGGQWQNVYSIPAALMASWQPNAESDNAYADASKFVDSFDADEKTLIAMARAILS